MRSALARSFALSMGLACAATMARPVWATTPELRSSAPNGQSKLIKVPAAQSITARDIGAAAEVSFVNIGTTGAETGADGLETTLRFDGPLDGQAAEKIASLLPRWIAYATPGYDSLLIRTRRKAAFGVTRNDEGFVLRISWAADPGDVARDNLQRLRLLTMTGETTRARAILNDLRRLKTDANTLDRAEAELLVAERDRRAALRKYEELESANPGDLGLRRSASSLRRDLSDYVETEVLRQSVEDGDVQTRVALRGRADIGPASSMSAEISTVHLDDDIALRSDGTIIAYDGAKTKLRASYDVDSGGGVAWSAILYAGAPGMGAGGEIGWRRASHELVLRASYNEPFFSFVESIVNDGVRHQVEASLLLRGARHWSAGATAAYNRYDLNNVDSAATTLAIDGFARYETPLDDRVTLIFSYALDAEYVGSVAVRTDALSAAFQPLPLSDREVHSLGVGLYAEWERGFSADAIVGYSYDRYAEGGAFARANLNYDVSDRWRAFANASYAQVNSRGTGGGAVTAGGVGLTYRFGGPGAVFRDANAGAGS